VTRAVIALGSNLGDREGTILRAIRSLAEADGVELTAVSKLIETVAITANGADESAPAYLNGVALIETEIEPHALLALLHGIEADNGRERGERWADRTLDLDLVAYGDQQIHDDELVVPHPRAAERDFVLTPWLDVDPDAVLPGVGRVADLRRAGS
jgi:2-amino-4-hydroxy-6-hydroxymethyldihydropteridine diphosphokinase